MARSRLIGAPQVLIYVNGKPFGKCTSLRWTSITPHKEQRSVDVLFPLEMIPTATSVAFELGVLRLVADGGMQAAGIVPQQQHLEREKYFTVQVVERKSGTTLFLAALCVCDSEVWGVPTKGLLAGTVACKGITWTNEAADAVPAT